MEQLGQLWVFVKAGCEFWMRLDDRGLTYTVHIEHHNFDYFEWGSGSDGEDFYVPTAERLDSVDGRDWYC